MNYELEDMTLAEWERKEEGITKRNWLQRVFERMSRHCVIFLTKTFLSGASREQLIEEMGYRNSHTFEEIFECVVAAESCWESRGTSRRN